MNKPFTKENFLSSTMFTIPHTNILLQAFIESNYVIKVLQKVGDDWKPYCTVPTRDITEYTFKAQTTTIFYKDFSCIINFSDLQHLNNI